MLSNDKIMLKTKVLSQKQILNSYRKRIHASFKRQQIAGQATIQAILEIGHLLIEVRDYKDALLMPHKERIWKEFVDELGFSMPSVTRYIKISEHQIINDKKYHQHLPSSVYSLYEISAIEPKQMLRLINAGSVYSEMGRSEISALKELPPKKKTQSDTVDLLRIKIPKDLLQGDYFSILNEIIEFLKNKEIEFEYGKEIAKADAEEQKIHRRIEKFVFNKAKIYFDQSIRKVIEQKGRESNLWKKSSRLSLKVKAEKVGYHFDEVSTSEVSSIEDLTAMYRVVEWEDEMSFTGDPVDFKILNHDFFKLNGVLPNGESFSFDIWDTTILRAFYKNGQITDLAVSKKLVKDLKRTTQNEVQLINVILKDGLPFVNPLNGVYILKKDFPQELLKFANEKNE